MKAKRELEMQGYAEVPAGTEDEMYVIRDGEFVRLEVKNDAEDDSARSRRH